MNAEDIEPVKEQTAEGRSAERPTKGWWRCYPVMMLLALASVHALAQQPVMDTTTMNAQADTVSDRLGARFVVGGIYAQGDRFRIYKNYYGGFGSEKLLDFSAEFWGMQVGAHLPVGAQVDFIAMAQYTMFPGWSFTTSVPDYTAPRLNFEWQMVDRTVRVPGSTFIGLRFGIQVFTRSNNLGDLLSATRGLQRQFWRRRVNRSGFHMSWATGPVWGWHKRVTRALPEVWPVNELIPESAVVEREEPYNRWYWNGSFDVGWTFFGRVDVSVGRTGVISLEGFPSSMYELASTAYAGRGYFTGSVAYILGRIRLTAQ